MSAKQVLQVMAKSRWGRDTSVVSSVHPITNEEYICICLKIHDTPYYASTTLNQCRDNRDYILPVSMLLDKVEMEVKKRYGILMRCPVS